ncbi:hypothetical protein F2Q68_00016767 [Brassica cretica]|uniref:Uncharacterized protein n=1 Tax=Brassica cretica TaxID=69181 RepID=A0A8S9HDZ9_BRACR|nr:hypothetical protein F2Q68_00016767 [Brassica cretica]
MIATVRKAKLNDGLEGVLSGEQSCELKWDHNMAVLSWSTPCKVSQSSVPQSESWREEAVDFGAQFSKSRSLKKIAQVVNKLSLMELERSSFELCQEQVLSFANAFCDICRTREDFMPEIDRVRFHREERSVSEDGGLQDPVREVELGASSSRFDDMEKITTVACVAPSSLQCAKQLVTTAKRLLHRNPPQKAKPRTRLPLSKPLPLLGTSFVVELNRHDVVVSPVVSELFATLT